MKFFGLKKNLAIGAVSAAAAFGSFALAAPAYAEEAPAQAAVDTANPVKTYEDIPTLQKALGFPVLYLPGDLYRAYDPAVVISAIGGRVSDLRFVNQIDSSELMVRTALRYDSGLDDISGFVGYEWATTQLLSSDLVTVDICSTDHGSYAARWVRGNFAFAIAMSNTTSEDFGRVLKSFFVTSAKFAYRFGRIKSAQRQPQ